jgi:hypothetical protein
MKKVLSIGLVGMISVAALAIESDPSNTVGFISHNLTAAGAAFTSFSSTPMGSASGVLATDIIGGQGANGDYILKWIGYWQTKNWDVSGTWSGLTMDYNAFYLYYNSTGSDQTLVVAGDVIPEGTPVVFADLAVGYTGFGNPLPMDIDMATDQAGLELGADGFVSGDFILRWAGYWATHTYNGATYSPALTLTAGNSYLLNAANAFTWDYTVGTAPAPLAVVNAPAKRKVARQINAQTTTK